jgi:hypothetical protein
MDLPSLSMANGGGGRRRFKEEEEGEEDVKILQELHRP